MGIFLILGSGVAELFKSQHGPESFDRHEISQVLTAASMMFRAVFWVLLSCKMIVDNHFTRQYNPEDSSEHLTDILYVSEILK
jgi:hypothetical protein